MSFLVLVDRFSGWFNIYHSKGGTRGLVTIFSRLFQDMGVPESLTTDRGTTYMSEQFNKILSDYGVAQVLLDSHMETLGVKLQLNRLKDWSDQILMTEVIWTQWYEYEPCWNIETHHIGTPGCLP